MKTQEAAGAQGARRGKRRWTDNLSEATKARNNGTSIAHLDAGASLVNLGKVVVRRKILVGEQFRVKVDLSFEARSLRARGPDELERAQRQRRSLLAKYGVTVRVGPTRREHFYW